jgi:Ca2+/H+ antiporter, TMEM165/GDT1 family
MNLRIFLMTFGAIFLAELADKTQLVGISMAAKYNKPFLVWSASVLAYMVITGLSVYLGSVIGKYIKPELVRYTAAAVFMILGILLVFKKF